MDYEILLLMLPLGIFLWWAAFYATKQMRIGKNKEREELAKRLLAKQAAERAVREATESSAEPKEQESH
jgi:hypothetical protein